MELRVLGPVAVQAGGRVLACARAQQSVVLAALVVDAGRPVPPEVLVDRVWGERPPERARRILHTHIARIRSLLREARALDGDVVELGRSGGYLLEVARDSVDLHRFRGLVGRADEPGRCADERAGLLGEALELWRSEPLTGLGGAWVEETRRTWRRQRLAVVIERARAELAAGRTSAAIEQATEELTEHPLVEPLAAVLMRALHSAGRSAEALDSFAAVRGRLADDLGADPGVELQFVHQAILRGESELASAADSHPHRRCRCSCPSRSPDSSPSASGWPGRRMVA